MRTVLAIIACLTVTPFSAAAGPRVDLNQDVARGDVLSPGWENWRVPEGPTATARFGELTITLRSAGRGANLRTAWWKPAFGHPARMASDGVVVAGGLELVLRGLPPGRHSLATYHNAFTEAQPGRMTVAVPGRAPVAVTPTRRVTHDADAASAH